jgi:RecA-family ATPase
VPPICSSCSDEDWAKENPTRANDIGRTGHAKRPEFNLIPFNEIKLDSASAYLVKGLIPRTGLTVIWGSPKCGKSFWAYDTTMHIVLGGEYYGRRVKKGAVVYCALEGAEGFRARIEAFRQARMAEDATKVPFYLIASPMSLVADCGALIASIEATLGQTVPAAVVIDTLNRSIAGSESDDRDMAAYIQAADAIRDAFKCAVIIVHHCGIDATRPRGHTSLTGAADAQLAIKRDHVGNIVVTVEWMKDGPASDEMFVALRSPKSGRTATAIR